MLNPSFERREFFQLAFLRHFGLRFGGRVYAVKGGACLRFFHRSPRLSEDMDIDVVRGVRMKTLQNAVDAVLTARAFAGSLLTIGILGLQVTKPKQAETTQRWKIALRLSGDTTLPTKLEFSRRRESLTYASGIPDAEILIRYKLPPFAAHYYDAAQMASQKILALTSLSRHAARDLFDLHHLFSMVKIEPALLARTIPQEAIDRAADHVTTFSHRDFSEEVLPYLPEDMMNLYADPDIFEKAKESVLAALARVME